MGIFGVKSGFLGLGKPTIKLEFETNEELVKFQERINNAQELEPVNFDKKKGFYKDELNGIDEETKEKFFKLIESNPQYINLKNDAKNYYSNLTYFKEDSNGIKKRAYKFISPIENIYSWCDFEHIIYNNSSRQNRTNILPLIKPTIEDPNLIINYEGENYYIKPFITENNKKILFSFIPTLVYNSNLKSLFTPKRNYLYNKFFDKETGKKKQTAVLRYQKNGILDASSIFNGTEPQGAPFEFVELRLFIIGTQKNKKGLKNQNESLGAPGDLYLVRDLRTRARKEPNELIANKNFKFTQLPAAKFENFNKNIYLQQKYLETEHIEGYKKIYLKKINNNLKAYFTFFVPQKKVKDENILIGSYFYDRAEVDVDLSKVYNLYSKFDNEYDVLLVDLKKDGNKKYISLNNFYGYVTNNYYKELKKAALNNLKKELEENKYYTKYQLKLFDNLYTNPTKYKIAEFNRFKEEGYSEPRNLDISDFNGLAANDAIYNNLDILDFNGLEPTYKQLNNYDAFFTKKADNNETFSGYGLDDTKKLIADTCRKHYKECAAIAEHLKASTALQSAFNLWHFMHNNIRYEYDREGREEIRTPLRTWADRFRGVDCDCLSVFTWCVLKCMGYNPAFELAAFRGKNQFSHIYINLDGIIIDRVWFVFNSLPPYISKRQLFKIQMFNLAGLF